MIPVAMLKCLIVILSCLWWATLIIRRHSKTYFKALYMKTKQPLKPNNIDILTGSLEMHMELQTNTEEM